MFPGHLSNKHFFAELHFPASQGPKAPRAATKKEAPKGAPLYRGVLRVRFGPS